ncbi:unnamed protein product [Rhizophagus irregularis]|nr:unnamed protein product [Rhizophagus irregularis]
MNKECGWTARRSTLSSASWKVNFFVMLVPLWNGLSTNGDVRSSDNIIDIIDTTILINFNKSSKNILTTEGK